MFVAFEEMTSNNTRTGREQKDHSSINHDEKCHATPSLGMLALMSQCRENATLSTPMANANDTATVVQPSRVGVDNQETERVYPGAFAVRGIDATCNDDEFTCTPPSMGDNTDDENLISARLVSSNEADVELLQEQVQEQEERLRQHEERLSFLAGSNVPVAQVTSMGSIDVNHGTSVRMGTESCQWSIRMPTQSRSRGVSEHAIRSLMNQGYSRGLAEAMTENTTIFPLRVWIIDNSGSMATLDGARLVESNNKNTFQYVQCTRWNELRDTVKYHAQTAALLKSPTVFRLLNDPGLIYGSQQFSIAEKGNDDEMSLKQDLQIAMKCMESSPGGMTPLSDHLRVIRNDILAMELILRQNGTRVAIILATDAIPTKSSRNSGGMTTLEEEFVGVLKSFEDLPVWMVIRLCTDDEKVVRFWNNLDSQLEYSIEVLDDYMNEAEEIYKHNPFLNYTLPLHRCRELGYYHRLFDIIDERELCKDDLVDLFTLLFGRQQMLKVPSPHADWKGFVQGIKTATDKEKCQWNPITRRVEPIVNIKKLDQTFGERRSRILRLMRRSTSQA